MKIVARPSVRPSVARGPDRRMQTEAFGWGGSRWGREGAASEAKCYRL